MKLDVEHIEAIAKLARLTLAREEKEHYAEELSAVLNYVEMLNEVDTDGVSETTAVGGFVDIVRDDAVVASDPDVREKLILQFPEKKGNLLKVKAVFT